MIKLSWKLKGGLSNCGLLDVIDTDAVIKDYSLEERVERENLILSIIAHRLAEYFHK